LSGAWGSLTRDDLREIEEHQTVVYALSENYDSEQAAEVSHRFLRLGRELIDAGATGLKYESGGVAHGKTRWIELSDRADRGFAAASEGGLDEDEQVGALMDFWGALIESYVQLPIKMEGDYYSCGMHLLGQPDSIIARALVDRAFSQAEQPTEEVVNLFFMFDYYLLAECPAEGVQEGRTFRMHEQAPRFRLKLEDCTGYDEDDFFFKPYGRWRFAENVSGL
jgi:hypothetical protein